MDRTSRFTEHRRATSGADRAHLRLVGGTYDGGNAARAFWLALTALNTAYTRVAAAMNVQLEQSDGDLAELSALGAHYGWISERRRLVETFLGSAPAVVEYAHCDCRNPEQIRSLAEAAIELAEDSGSLSSALGLLGYIDRELGWSGADDSLIAV